MKIRVLRPCSVLVQAGSEVLVDQLTGEALVRAKVAEEIPPLPPVETPKKRYRLGGADRTAAPAVEEEDGRDT